VQTLNAHRNDWNALKVSWYNAAGGGQAGYFRTRPLPKLKGNTMELTNEIAAKVMEALGALNEGVLSPGWNILIAGNFAQGVIGLLVAIGVMVISASTGVIVCKTCASDPLMDDADLAFTKRVTAFIVATIWTLCVTQAGILSGVQLIAPEYAALQEVIGMLK
jgi:hypothetical protein